MSLARPALPHTASLARGPARSEWIHICNGLDPRRDGGMVPSILGMTGALARREGRVTVVTPTPSRLEGTGIPDGVELVGPERDLERHVRRAGVVHLHGLWQGHTRRAAREARLRNVPYVLAAHGMAEPWALRHKSLKKRVYTFLVEGRNLRRASCLHALSRPEIGHLRALSPRSRIALVPNGVDVRPFDNLPGRASLEAIHPEVRGKFVLLFMGRLHIKKGLDLLAEAMRRIAPFRPELHLLLAGNDDGAKGPFLDRLSQVGLGDRVTILGHLSGHRAMQAWGAADAFILPSYSEGFSMAILEALAARLPVLVTTACHFPELAVEQAGLVVEPTVEGVTKGLSDLLDCSPADRASLGSQGRRLVELRYTWDRQAERLAEVYRWVAGAGPLPEAVLDAEQGGPS